MSSLVIRLFGSPTLQRNAIEVAGLHAGKLRELFCYLLLERHRIHSRETLASLFWGECTTVQSRKYLRQALWQLGTVLASSASDPGSRILRVDSESVAVDPEADLWLDVAVFENASVEAQGCGSPIDGPRAKILAEAVQLYRADLLEGWYQDWCLFQRERLQNLYLSMLDRLICYCESEQLYEAGLEYGERILSLDRAHERTHQRMLRLRYLSGDRAGALRQYQRCVAALADELDVRPAQRTTALYHQICSDQIERSDRDGAMPETPSDAAPPSGSSQPTDVLARLRALKALLFQAQEQVLQGIYAVEKSIAKQPKIVISPKRRPAQSSSPKASLPSLRR